VSGDHDAISGKVKTTIPFVVRGIADENRPGGMRSKLMQGYRRQVGVADTPKDLKMLIGGRCVVEGSVRIGGNDGFCQKTVQQVCSSVEVLYLILW
jgi:hypothetical protein